MKRQRLFTTWDTEGTESELDWLQRLNRLRKNVVSGLQGLKPLKKTQPLCRA